MISLGYEVGSGKEVLVPLGHTIVTGQSQRSGKTTALEAMAARTLTLDDVPTVIAFVTKRGEGSFAGLSKHHAMQPFFRQRTDWRFVEATLESAFDEGMKFERTWIIKACRNAKTLADVRRNAADLHEKAKRGMDKDLFMLVGEYLDEVLPDIESLPSSSMTFSPALSEVNVVDLVAWRPRMQMLFVASALDHIARDEDETVVIIPESWSMLPEHRKTPVKEPAVEIARKGAAVGNYLWLDCQDITGVSKEIIRQSSVWLLGVQREANEISRTLKHIPAGLKKPKADDVARLELGQFFVCTPDGVTKTYVRPAWMLSGVAEQIATGRLKVSDAVADRKKSLVNQKVAYGKPQAHLLPIPRQKPDIEDVVTSLVAGLRDELIARLDIHSKSIATITEQVGMIMRGDWPAFLPPGVQISREKPLKFVDEITPPPNGPKVAKNSKAFKFEQATKIALKHAPNLMKVDPKPYDAKGWTPMEEELYQKFKARFISELRDEEPKILRVLATKPELEVAVERKTVTLDGSSLRGRVASLVQARFFDQPKEGNVILKELYRRGGTIGDARNYKRELGWLTENGFLTLEEDGYLVVKGMKINIVQK